MQGTEERNRAIARRFVDEVFNRGNTKAYDELVADDYINHNPPVPGLPGSKVGFQEAVILTRDAFPDVHVSIEDMLTEGDRVMFRDTTTATHQGEFQGIPASGKRLAWTEMHFFRIRDGQIAEHWANFDQLGILVQMDVFPSPADSAGHAAGSHSSGPTMNISASGGVTLQVPPPTQDMK
jgi:steroid delta-isomerase-like uncharacterized protein